MELPGGSKDPRQVTEQPGGLYAVAPSLARSPLGIIALFILLVYAISGIVCATWTPPVPEALVWFIVLFPVLVFLVFTWLVVEHHLKLHGPGDFTDHRNWLAVQQSIAEAAKAMDALQPVISQTTLPPEVDVLAKLDQVQEAIAQRTGVDLSRLQASKPPEHPVAEAPAAAPTQKQGVKHATRVREVNGPLGAADADDPQKGQWGGKRSHGDYHVEVAGNRVLTLLPGVYRVTLRVFSSHAARKLTRPVVLHLHPSFDPPQRTVAPVGGEVRFPMVLWGSFTVGVEIDETDAQGAPQRTRLELDLADPDIVSDQAFKDT